MVEIKHLSSNPRVTYKLATDDDMTEFYGERPAFTGRAIVFFLDGEIAGLGGWKIDGSSYVVFSEIKEGVKVEKSTVFRCARIILDMVSEKNCPMYAVTHNPKFLERLGFKPFETVTDNKEYYVWQ